MTQCIAAPLSRNSIRNRANIIRCIAGAENDLFFDIVKFVEVTLPSIDPDFNFRVVAEDKLGECHGITYPDKDEIQIRQDVYDRAVDGNGRDRLTVAHELGHLLLHEKQNISYARMGDGSKVNAYQNPEWQASAFGGELLIPHKLIQGMTVEAIMKSCKVSKKAALYQMEK